MRARCRFRAWKTLLVFAGAASASVLAAKTTETPAPSPSTQSASTSSQAPRAPTSVPASVTTPFGEITGTVKSGNVPLPGVTVSAANTLTGKKYITSTDTDGSFKIAVGGKG